jgi:hypothetical protein
MQATIAPSTSSAAVELVPQKIESSFMSYGRRWLGARVGILIEHNSSDLAKRSYEAADFGASHLYIYGQRNCAL